MPDLKAWLCAAAENLPPGGVVKPATLSNMEAMNALEASVSPASALTIQMMDPQMDWGMNFNPHGQFDPGAPLSPDQICWVMDEMAAREVAWLRGGTLAQTVFTSLHYHNALDIVPSRAPSDPAYLAAYSACAALRAFVLGYAKGIELAYNALCDANGVARDGEDIWLDPYGIPLETSEGVPDVLAYLDGVVRWLAQRDVYAGVVRRLRLRGRWIAALQLRLQPGADDDLLAGDGELTPEPVPWAFDDIASLLRQNMPLPALSFPNHAEMWEALLGAISQLRQARVIATLPLAMVEKYLANLPEMLPIVRALYRAVINDLERDALVDQWLASATGAPLGVLDRLDREITVLNDRRAFVLWRDIVAGNFVQGLTSRLQNPPRRRRALQHLSRTWCDQATQAARLQLRGYPAFAPIVAALRARALDSDLAAALAAISLRLLARHERRAQWWWILRVTSSRLALGMHDAPVEWARAWAAVASGMLILYTLVPTGDPSRPEFALRHKIALGTGSHPAPPLFSAWEAAKAALDEAYAAARVDGAAAASARRTALEWFQNAHELMAALGAPERVRADLATNITVLEGLGDGGQLGWMDDDAGSTELGLPRLLIVQ